jgi:hypothetical protein
MSIKFGGRSSFFEYALTLTIISSKLSPSLRTSNTSMTGLTFCTRNRLAGRIISGDTFNVNRILPPDRTRSNKSSPSWWELTLIAHLLLAVKVRDARIARLEQLDYQKALALDEQRRRAERRAA